MYEQTATVNTLKALDANIANRAFVLDGGRAGDFTWRDGDYSSQVAADVAEAIFVESVTVQAEHGVWMRAAYNGKSVETCWFGNDWQAAVDLADVLGVPTVVTSGTYVATAETGPLYMRAGVTLGGCGKLVMGNCAQLLRLLDFDVNAAHGAGACGITIDGNRANNSDDLISKHLVVVGDAHDVAIKGCTIVGSNGTGIYVRNAFGAVIHKNKFSNVFVTPIYVAASIKSNYRVKITKNTIDGRWGQHAIVVKYSNFADVSKNYIVGQCTRGFNVNVTYGGNVTSLSGPAFTPESIGMFVILGGGTEALAVVYDSPILVATNINIPNPGSVPAVVGNGDVISIQGSDDCDVYRNLVYGGASLGISVFSDGVHSANRNSVRGNRVHNQGSAGISTQNAGATGVNATLIDGNFIVDCGLNRGAAATEYNVAIAVRGGANTSRVIVTNNVIEGYQNSMDYGIAFDSAVSGKNHSNNSINGTIGGKKIHLP